MKKTILGLLLIGIVGIAIYYFLFKKKPDESNYFQKKYKDISKKDVILDSPTYIDYVDTLIILKNLKNYIDNMASRKVEYIQQYGSFFIDKDFLDSLRNCNGIRIYNAINNSEQNRIVKFIGNNDSIKNASAFLVVNSKNLCSDRCDNGFQNSPIPNSANNSRLDNRVCYEMQKKYDEETSRDSVTSVLIPKVIIDAVIANKITFVRVYNGINERGMRVVYVISYNEKTSGTISSMAKPVGEINLNASFALDENYLCPNYCDGAKYIFK